MREIFSPLLVSLMRRSESCTRSVHTINQDEKYEKRLYKALDVVYIKQESVPGIWTKAFPKGNFRNFS